MNNKKMYLYSIVLITFAFITLGCETTAHYVSSQNIKKDTTVFNISYQNDPLGISNVIASELSERGYRVQLKQVLDTSTPLPTPNSSYGSGFFISSDGLLISNAHVIKDADNIMIKTTDGAVYSASVIKVDENNDIAILQLINGEHISKWLSLSEFRTSYPGDTINIIGYPLTNLLGTSPRITDGIISAEVGLKDDPTRFQVSAPIQPGNSGGPIS